MQEGLLAGALSAIDMAELMAIAIAISDATHAPAHTTDVQLMKNVTYAPTWRYTWRYIHASCPISLLLL